MNIGKCMGSCTGASKQECWAWYVHMLGILIYTYILVYIEHVHTYPYTYIRIHTYIYTFVVNNVLISLNSLHTYEMYILHAYYTKVTGVLYT